MLQDVPDIGTVRDKGDDAHLCVAFGALKGIYFVDSLYARGPTALTELDSTELAEVLAQIRNPNLEIRNNARNVGNSKHETEPTHRYSSAFRASDFEFVSDFDIRISSLKCPI